MKRVLTFLGLMSIAIVSGQENRVGINTETPQATLDVKETALSLLPQGTPQGVLFPNFTSDERDTFTPNVKEGIMIYNTTLDCVEQYTFRNNTLDWHCMCLCNDNTVVEPVLEQDDEVLITLMGQTNTYAVDYSYTFGTARINNNQRVSMMYSASESGRYTEKRYTQEWKVYKNGTAGEIIMPITLVIPAGNVTAGLGEIEGYLEFDANFIHLGASQIHQFVVTIGGKTATIEFETESEW